MKWHLPQGTVGGSCREAPGSCAACPPTLAGLCWLGEDCLGPARAWTPPRVLDCPSPDMVSERPQVGESGPPV